MNIYEWENVGENFDIGNHIIKSVYTSVFRKLWAIIN